MPELLPFGLYPTYFLLLLISTSYSAEIVSREAEGAPWPYDLPPNVKHFPGDQRFLQERLNIQERISSQTPVGVYKMGFDEAEMFFPSYWLFDIQDDNPTSSWANEDSSTLQSCESCGSRGRIDSSTNISAITPPQAPYMLHCEKHYKLPAVMRRLAHLPQSRALSLFKRDFKCPGNTLSCISISRPNSCCPIGEACQLISDTGLGDVGCCAEGQSCSGQLSGCQDGYLSCPSSSGGGCCIPGYECVGIGCIKDLLKILNLVLRVVF